MAMNRGVKLLLVVAVLAGGGAVAMMFRKPADEQPQTAAPSEQPSGEAVEGDQPPQVAADATDGGAKRAIQVPDNQDAFNQAPTTGRNRPWTDDPFPAAKSPPPGRGGSTTFDPPRVAPDFTRKLSPTDNAAQFPPEAAEQPVRLPPIDRQRPAAGRPLSQSAVSAADIVGPAPLDEPQAVAAVSPIRTHRIVDGDTLTDLARHYLGDARRAAAIYDANRHLLRHPDLLPIGVTINIPPPARWRPTSTPASAADAEMVPVPRRW